MNQPRNLAASVRQRLLNLAQAQKEDFNLVLTRYGIERLLYRLHSSSVGERFILKGAMLFIHDFLMPPIIAINEGVEFDLVWSSNLGWHSQDGNE